MGCGFLRNENTQSFVWFFEHFLDAMGGVAPACIITDQDLAMAAGIQIVFSNTVHRNCRWHVVSKAQGKLGNLFRRMEGLA